MSLKIWTAYRFNTYCLNEFSNFTTPIAVEEAKKFIRKILSEKREDCSYMDAAFSAMDLFRAAARLSAPFLSIKSGFDCINDGAMTYAIPYGAMPHLKELPDWVERYDYQNCTDMDENMDPEVWAERGETWDRIIVSNNRPVIYDLPIIYTDCRPTGTPSTEMIILEVAQEFAPEDAKRAVAERDQPSVYP